MVNKRIAAGWGMHPHFSGGHPVGQPRNDKKKRTKRRTTMLLAHTAKMFSAKAQNTAPGVGAPPPFEKKFVPISEIYAFMLP
jgi:hypothetical protein